MVSRVGPISVVVMSVSEVLAPSQTMHEKNGNAITKTKNVAIVAPQRSNSLDYLNFEEKRRLIASSLSLSDFLAAGNNTTKELKDAVVVGECCAHLEQRMRSGDHRGLSFALSTKFACRVEVLSSIQANWSREMPDVRLLLWHFVYMCLFFPTRSVHSLFLTRSISSMAIKEIGSGTYEKIQFKFFNVCGRFIV